MFKNELMLNSSYIICKRLKSNRHIIAAIKKYTCDEVSSTNVQVEYSICAVQCYLWTSDTRISGVFSCTIITILTLTFSKILKVLVSLEPHNSFILLVLRNHQNDHL